jgi:hypothetical protein
MTQRIWGLRFWQWCSCGFHSSGTWSCVRRESESSILKDVHSSKINPDLLNLGDVGITFLEKVRVPSPCDTVSRLRCLVSMRRISPDLRFSQQCCWGVKSPGMWCHVKWVGLNMFKALNPVDLQEQLTQWQSIKYQAIWHLRIVPQLTLRYDSPIGCVLSC